MGLSLKSEAVAKRRQIFARHYARSGNGSAAARAAGYSRPNEPARLLALPDVQLAISEARKDPEALTAIRYPIHSKADRRRFHFACLYLESMGSTAANAAKAAGYASPAWSATFLLQRDDVRQWIARLAQAATDDPKCSISKSLASLYAEAAENPTVGYTYLSKSW